MTITFSEDDIRAYRAYREFMSIANSDLLSVFNKYALRYCPSFDARRLYERVVEMVEVQSDLDAGLL